jgi:hypothetical protein
MFFINITHLLQSNIFPEELHLLICHSDLFVSMYSYGDVIVHYAALVITVGLGIYIIVCTITNILIVLYWVSTNDTLYH